MKALILLFCVLPQYCFGEMVIIPPVYPNHKNYACQINKVPKTPIEAYEYTLIINESQDRFATRVTEAYNIYVKYDYHEMGPTKGHRYFYIEHNRFYYCYMNITYQLDYIREKVVKRDEDIYNKYFFRKYTSIGIFDEVFALTNACIFAKNNNQDYSEYLDRLDIAIEYCEQIRNLSKDFPTGWYREPYTNTQQLMKLIYDRRSKLME